MDIINNCLKLDLKQLPTQNSMSSYPLSSKENEIISVGIKKLLKKSVIVYSTPEEGEFISGIFTRDKKDGNKRMILNLKKISKFANYKHCNMESINNVINLIESYVYMASINLKDAFFSVLIHNDHQKDLKFIFGNLFQFTSIPNGYGPAMRIFTKISKVPFAFLRGQGHNSVVYVDESYLQGDTYQSRLVNILDTTKLLRELGFLINPDKSVLIPTQTIVFLGFVISSKHMTPSLTGDKKCKIKNLLVNCLHSQQVSKRELARMLGNIVASFPAVTFGPLHYRHLETVKIRGLKYHKGNFKGEINLSVKVVSEIHLWINNIDNSCHHINSILNPDITIHTDASVLASKTRNHDS